MKTLDEESVFHRAIEINDEKTRTEFLDQVCGDDRDARKRIGDLVNMHFRAGSILDETRDCQIKRANLANVPEVGTTIGPYKLLQQIGDGGMGVVFMAQQTEPVKRKVAMKVIKVGMDTRSVVARFESERQAMAMMDHPCITRILDAGETSTGRPFFVMELVRGKSITAYCDEHRLSIRQRLEIFVQVCNALEHAHQKGIIHRDIKPNNVMVTNQDGHPLPKIIDFGIAKAINDPLTEKTLFTRYGEMVGTPLYMSPEQSELSEPDIDTRTDIYSLGVLLYELLTGTTPFHNLKTKSYHDICEAIRSNDPQLASTRINQLGDTVEEITTNRGTDMRSLQRFIQGELDWILMKCLARDRTERYQSAGELSREIQRYLNGEFVEAAAPTWRYRTRKFAARHKAGVAIAASFAAILLATTLFSSFMAYKANEAQKLANTRLLLVEQQRDRALAAERELAELERKQREQVVLHQSVATYNANKVKKYLTDTPVTIEGSTGATIRPLIHVKPIGSCWQTPARPAGINSNEVAPAMQMTLQGGPQTKPKISRSFPSRAVVEDSQYFVHRDQPNSSWIFHEDSDGADIEVILVSGELECEFDCKQELLQSILDNQIKAFGGRDVVVARTLQQLGELTWDERDWEQSEKYFREALDIFQEKVTDRKQLAAIRMKLVSALERQGQLAKVVDELKEMKETFKQSELHDDVSGLLKKIHLKMRKSKREPGVEPDAT